MRLPKFDAATGRRIAREPWGHPPATGKVSAERVLAALLDRFHLDAVIEVYVDREGRAAERVGFRRKPKRPPPPSIPRPSRREKGGG